MISILATRPLRQSSSCIGQTTIPIWNHIFPVFFPALAKCRRLLSNAFLSNEPPRHIAYPAVATALPKIISLHSVSIVEIDPLKYLDAAELVSLVRRVISHIRHLSIDFPLFYLHEPPTYAVNSHVGEIPGLPLIELESLRLTSWFHCIEPGDILQIQKIVIKIGESLEHLTIFIAAWNRRHDAPLDDSTNSRLSCVDIIAYVFPVEGWYKHLPFKSTVKHMRFDIQYRERNEENVG
ncbi:hypothetical protein F5146DRAFT_1002422 [Armillaria mellea]|nr:hypothetical protein F5146DRAFT_1002422 [Armillaria mellea]